MSTGVVPAVGRRWTRRLLLLCFVLGAAWLLSACHGGPHTLFTVNTTQDLADAVPGDGACQTSSGNCSLRAAISEARVTPGEIHLPAGTYNLTRPGIDDTNAGGDLDIAAAGNELKITADAPGAVIDASGEEAALDISSGWVSLDRVAVRDASGPGIELSASARLITNRTTVHSNSGNGITVPAGALLSMSNSTVADNGGDGINRGGSVTLWFATVAGNTGNGLTGSGAASLTATVVADNGAADCTGPSVTTKGHNLDTDGSCGLTGTGDDSNQPAGLSPLSSETLAGRYPLHGSSVRDVIPAANSTCSSNPADQQGAARPIDGACDRGALEDHGLALVVNDAADTHDANPGNRICATATGTCTLRAAIDETNLVTHTYSNNVDLNVNPTLAIAGAGDDNNASGDIDTTTNLTIDGNNHIIDANQIDRVIHHRVGDLTLHDATVTDGRTTVATGHGAGIDSVGRSLTVRNVTVTGNQATNGAADGGGIATSNGSRLVIDSSILSSNTAGDNGGALSIASSPTAAITDSDITANQARNGAGIHTSSSTLALAGVEIAANSIASGVAGSGGGIFASQSTIDIDTSLLTGNTASQSGGGLAATSFSLVNVTNSTLSGNSAVVAGAAISHTSSSTGIDLSHVTIAANTGPTALSGTGTVRSKGSVLATSTGAVCAGTTLSGGFTVASDSSCALSGSGDQQAVSPMLTALAANGGPTLTHLPYANSPVIDAIPAGTAGLCDASTPTDQRGQPRPVGPACDIGAVEGHNGQSPAPLDLTVNSALDTHDTNPGNGICATAAATCTLRAAIDETNAWPTTDAITLAVDSTLSLTGTGDDLNATGDLDVIGHLTIHGAAHTVDASQLDRVFHLRAGLLAIDNAIITGGRLTTANAQGGGFNGTGDLVLDGVTVVDNEAGGASGQGGGVYVLNSGAVVLDSVDVNDNTSSSGGGGIHAENATVDIVSSTFTENVAGTGGGGALTLDEGTFSIDRSTIADNAANHGAGIWVDGELIIDESTIARNAAASEGGGLVVDGALAQISNSTLSGNSATTRGAAVYVGSGAVSLTYTTIQRNVGPTSFYGSSLYPPITVEASILTSISGPLCDTDLVSNGWNIASDTSCNLDETTDQTDIEPLLTLLADHGGPTDTHLPFADSPVVDVIPAGTAGVCDASTTDDQRGQPRPQGGACDVGSVEGDTGAPAAPLSLVVNTGVDAPDVVPGNGICATAAASCTLRAAIEETNAWPTADQISIAPGVAPVLSLVGANENDNATGDLDIWDHLTITGTGNTVDANSLDRVMHHHGGDLEVDGLVMTDGNPSAPDETGGAIKTKGDLTLIDSTLVNNDAADGGGGIYATQGLYGTGGPVEVIESTISDNTTTGVETENIPLSIDHSEISGNESSGVSVYYGSLMLSDSTLSENGSISSAGGGVFVDNNATAVISSSLLIDNTAQSGGAVDIDGGSATIVNSTLARNEAYSGSALYAGPGGAGIISSTIADNVGSFAIDGYSSITASGSIISADTQTACADTVNSTGWNLVSDSSCGLTQPTDEEDIDPLLGLLGDNGGPTLTYLPYSNSPAVDAIPAGAPGLCDGAIPTDQRGQPRPGGPACDIGAVEGYAGAATPLSLTVNSGADVHDAVPGDGSCDTGAGTCTLRAAIDETNSHPTPDTVTIAAGVDTVLAIGGASEDANATGDLDITDDLTIDANGNTIDANTLDRAIDHLGGSLSLREATVTRGLLTTGPGGGIKSTSAGTLDLIDSVIVDNEVNNVSYQGGGLSLANGGTTIDGSQIVDNFNSNSGGGLAVDATTLTVTDSSLTGNHSGMGGGIAAGNATVSITDTVFSDNSATSYGGGMRSESSTVTLLRTTLDGNAGSSGGGIATNLGGLSVVDSTLTDNGGGAMRLEGPFTIASSTIARNVSGFAGAIDSNSSGSITNTTISGNTTPGVFTSVLNHSSGVVVYRGSTIFNNQSGETMRGNASITLTGTILGAGYGTGCGGGLVPSSGGYNLASDSSCGLTQPTDQQGVSALLGQLADNGGPTSTHLPFANSPAVDAIPVGTAGLCDAAQPTDQRGVARPDGPACDIGAVEGDSGTNGATGPLNLTVVTATDGGDVTPGDGICAAGGGSCTLRAAIDETNAVTTGIDTLTIAPGINPTLTIAGASEDSNATGDLDVLGSLTVHGGNQTVSAGSLDRVIHHQIGTLTLNDLTVTGGRITAASGEGGGIRTAGTLVVDQSTVTGNQITGTGGRGAGIHAAPGSAVTITNSTLRNNSTSGSAAQGGAIYANGAALTVTDSTLSSNISFTGAALYHQAGSTTLTASTLAANSGNWVIAGTAPMTLRGTVIGTGGVNACASAATSTGYNIAFGTSCGLTQPTDLQNTNALLGALANNGGPTLTHLPLAGSPALDSVPGGSSALCDGTLPTDQRGVIRPQGTGCDRGAVELELAPPLSLTVTSAADAHDTVPGDGVCATAAATCTLRAALDETNTSPGNNTITIAPGVNPTLALAGSGEDANANGDLDIAGNVTINGNGQTVNAGTLDRVIHHHSGVLTINDLIVTGGRITTASGEGAGIRTAGALMLDQSTITGNQITGTTGRGAGLHAGAGSNVAITNSTLNANSTSGGAAQGGAIYAGGTNLAVTNTALSGNTSFSGAGIYRQAGTSIVTASTLAAHSGSAVIGGTSLLTLRGSIISAGGVNACSVAVTSGGHNIVFGTSCALSQTSDLQSTDALLGALANNGGPTLTHLPGIGSPAIDSIPLGTVGLCNGSVPADQRGIARPQGGACDRGSVEQ